MSRLLSIIIFVVIILFISGIAGVISEKKAAKEKAKYEATLSKELKDLRKTVFDEHYTFNSNSFPDSPHAIIFRKGKSGPEIYEDIYKILPENIKSKNMNLINTAILYIPGEVTVGSYTNGGAAIKQYVDLVFINVRTKTIFKNKRIEGGDPPSSIRVRAGSKANGYGSFVSKNEVVNYITTFLE